MAQETKVGLLFYNDPNWIAGTYYILNLVNALNSLEENEKMQLGVLSPERKDFTLIQATGYPYLRFYDLHFVYNSVEKLVNKIGNTLAGRKLIHKGYGKKDFDIIFPYSYVDSIRSFKNRLYWIPDFQEKYFPEFFSKEELVAREAGKKRIAVSGEMLVFSSNDALDDFNRFYPGHKCRTFVLHFACSHPEFTQLDLEELKAKFNIKGEYFFSPNQFWEHKNHFIILHALRILKERGRQVLVVFTGKEDDYRNKDYFQRLKGFVIMNGLEENVRFLGFIDRKEQLKLMEGARSVIQPSLFEGWSTVVEDAKAMNQFVLLSDLKVHREQLDYNCDFFDPYNPVLFADKMMKWMDQPVVRITRDYHSNVKRFGRGFLEIVNEVNRI
jgi:glycosyltransferase involved in cell wall biosynthesis